MIRSLRASRLAEAYWRAAIRVPFLPFAVVVAEDELTKLKYLIPTPVRDWLNRRRERVERGLLIFDRVTDWSVLRRLHPYRRRFGERRGSCIDRFYIEKFIHTYQECVRGRVVEVQGDDYTRAYGGERVEHSDILDIDGKNQKRTIALDLTQTASAPERLFDCIICTQTLNLIYDCGSAVRSLHRMLRSGGVLLATVPGIAQRLPREMLGGAEEDCWRFTENSAKRLFGQIFGSHNVVVHTYGNVLTAIGLLHGLVQEELQQNELEYHDPDYEVIIGIKATKQADKLP